MRVYTCRYLEHFDLNNLRCDCDCRVSNYEFLTCIVCLVFSNLLDPLWQDFFHNLLNPEDNSTEFILTNLINNLKNTVYEELECQFSL